MKYFMIAWCFFATMALSFGQKIKSDKVPDAVKMAFAKVHPGVSDIDWEQEDGGYEAEFDGPNDVEMSAVFAADGKWLETEQEIKKSELPAPILAKLKGKKIKEATKIIRADGSTIYEAEVKRKDLLFDAWGNTVK